MFHRLHADGTQTPVPLENLFAGTTPAACWLLGGGPSLAALPTQAIADSPLPKMAINLAGTKLLRPTFWTSYDPSVRFHRSIYLDPGIAKFVHRRRAMDLVPETTFKVCDCPHTLFFERDPDRGFGNLLDPRHTGIVDWADSMAQAIDILYRLGFRTLYLAGCEMRVRPSAAQRDRAAQAGVIHTDDTRLDEWLNACRKAGLSDRDLDALDPALQYHFDEHKPIAAAASTDLHYFRVVQYLRLARRNLALAGLRLVSVTPHSRLNDYFPCEPIEAVLDQIRRDVGDPPNEPTRGLYQQITPRQPTRLAPMRDYKPHNWPTKKPIPPQAIPEGSPQRAADGSPDGSPKRQQGQPHSAPIPGDSPQREQGRADHAITPDAPCESQLLIEHEGCDHRHARLQQALDALPHPLPDPIEQPA